MHKTVATATKCPCGYEKCDAGGDEKLKIKVMWPNGGVQCKLGKHITAL